MSHCELLYPYTLLYFLCAFSALTLLAARQEERLACKKLADEALMWLSVWSDVQIVCIGYRVNVPKIILNDTINSFS